VCGDGGFVEFHNVVSKDKLYDFVIETVRLVISVINVKNVFK